MKEVHGNAWEMLYGGEYQVLCITTNGMVNKYGECVMGRGIAYQFKSQFPQGAKILGDKIKSNGNIVQPIMWNDTITFLAFPVKHKWFEVADVDLIKSSAESLVKFAKENSDKKILLPRPGCGNGQLDWEKDVKHILVDLLPDNVYIVSFI